MNHLVSTDDRAFQAEFESCRFPSARFDHRAHLRLAYVYLAQHDIEIAHRLMRGALKIFIEQNPRMLDAKIMMTHYSAELIFSERARAKYVEPDLDPIPRYDQ